MSRGLKILLIILVILIAFFLASGVASRPAPISGERASVIVGGHTLSLEIADEWTERVRGLSDREDFDEETGLLFVFEKSDHHGIWMKDMNFSIDIIWLESLEGKKGQMRIVDIEENVDPDTYPTTFRPDKPAVYVIELAAGVSRNIGLEERDILDIAFKDVR
ncbi:MAG: DUF192 domain-containing protein [Candidatus Paceibacterota bacterium]